MKNLQEAIEFIYAALPNSFDRTPNGEIMQKSKIGTVGYYENEEFSLMVTTDSIQSFDVHYTGESGEVYYVLSVHKEGNKFMVCVDESRHFKLNRENVLKGLENMLLKN